MSAYRRTDYEINIIPVIVNGDFSLGDRDKGIVFRVRRRRTDSYYLSATVINEPSRPTVNMSKKVFFFITGKRTMAMRVIT